MYRKKDGQITIAEFLSPFGTLDKNNRWVKIADMIPWERYESEYAKRFCPDNGSPAINFRIAMGTLLLKQFNNYSDDDVILNIQENPYMQYLIGLHEFTHKAPFAQSSITNFRKYIPEEMINRVNEDIFRASKEKKDDDDQGGSSSDNQVEESKEPPPNKGTLMVDATCTPADISYPTDVNLLNEAREKLEGMIDTLHPHTGNKVKPRTYRRKARRDYLHLSKQRKPRKKSIRKAIRQQLGYVQRNLKHIDKLIVAVGIEHLTKRQQQWLETIRILYKQQLEMYESKSHSVKDRIVSIGQPHVRPIVRGKVNAPVEFGAKISISLIDGYAFIDKIGWDAYNEEALLIPAIEKFKEQNGYYPESVLADKIYRNKDNRAFCKKHGIRLSGPRLGRPAKETKQGMLAQGREDAARRNAVEGKIGEGKTCYGLDRVMARLQGSSETVIAMSFLCMNISRRLRVLSHLFYKNFNFGLQWHQLKYNWVFE